MRGKGVLCPLCGQLIINMQSETDDDTLNAHLFYMHFEPISNATGRRCPLCKETAFTAFFHLAQRHPDLDLHSFFQAIILGVQP